VDSALEQRIQNAYAAFMSGDLDAVMEQFAPEATYTNPDYAVEDGVRRGLDELRASFEALRDGFDYASVELERLIEGPGGVLAVVHVDASGRSSGAPFEGLFVHVFRFRDGRVVDFAWYATVEEGRQAVGL
jgi:ketosteroid isomerase-like protein